MDCPGCGFQRSFLFLIKGEWQKSFELYPATVPVVLTFTIVLTVKYGFKMKSERLVKTLYLITGSVIFISYVVKMFGAHVH